MLPILTIEKSLITGLPHPPFNSQYHLIHEFTLKKKSNISFLLKFDFHLRFSRRRGYGEHLNTLHSFLNANNISVMNNFFICILTCTNNNSENFLGTHVFVWSANTFIVGLRYYVYYEILFQRIVNPLTDVQRRWHF